MTRSKTKNLKKKSSLSLKQQQLTKDQQIREMARCLKGMGEEELLMMEKHLQEPPLPPAPPSSPSEEVKSTASHPSKLKKVRQNRPKLPPSKPTTRVNPRKKRIVKRKSAPAAKGQGLFGGLLGMLTNKRRR